MRDGGVDYCHEPCLGVYVVVEYFARDVDELHGVLHRVVFDCGVLLDLEEPVRRNEIRWDVFHYFSLLQPLLDFGKLLILS